ncbi:nucleoid-associated protein [Sedimenticola sp.]|uniref:nucleoid-associated protein n=1 Tax=Sedimenticola sp. TaxID=1940285 RepID=UPI003D0BC556
MTITHCITHQIHPDESGAPALHLRETELPVDDQVETLAADLKRAYLSRINREYGRFSEASQENGLAGELAQFCTEQVDFVTLSSRLGKQLLQRMQELGSELRGHLILFIEQQHEQQALYLFIVSQRIASRINERQEVEPVLTLDFGASMMALKVDLTLWRSEAGDAYLSMSPSRARGMAELLQQLAGFSASVDKAAATRDFLERIETFSQKLPEEQVGDFRNQVVEYCVEQDLQDAPVEIGGLSQALDGVDTSAFSSYLADHLPEGGGRLLLDRKSLRRYVKFAGRERDLAISFSSYQLNKRIHYQAESDTLSITGLPKMLRSQLLGHVEE